MNHLFSFRDHLFQSHSFEILLERTERHPTLALKIKKIASLVSFVVLISVIFGRGFNCVSHRFLCFWLFSSIVLNHDRTTCFFIW